MKKFLIIFENIIIWILDLFLEICRRIILAIFLLIGGDSFLSSLLHKPTYNIPIIHKPTYSAPYVSKPAIKKEEKRMRII